LGSREISLDISLAFSERPVSMTLKSVMMMWELKDMSKPEAPGGELMLSLKWHVKHLESFVEYVAVPVRHYYVN
jgi:hypothetical protein